MTILSVQVAMSIVLPLKYPDNAHLHVDAKAFAGCVNPVPSGMSIPRCQ